MPCEWDYAAILLNRRTFGHALPAPDTSLKEKSLKSYFYGKLHLLSFP